MQKLNLYSLKDNAAVMVCMVIAVATGFLRQMAIADVLGAGRTTDIFLIAYSIPEFVYIALPIILPPVFIPFFFRFEREYGDRYAWDWGLKMLAGSFAFLAALSIVMELIAPVYMIWLTPGFQSLERGLAVQIQRTMLVSLPFIGLMVVSSAILQVYRKFVVSILSTALYNLFFIAALKYLPQSDLVFRSGVSVILAFAASFLFQVPSLLALHRIQPARVVPGIHLHLDSFRRRVGPMLAGYSVHHLILFIDRAMATSFGVGSLSALTFAYHLALSIGQVSGLAISTVLFPDLAREIEGQNHEKSRLIVVKALQAVWFFALPVCMAFILLRTPLVRLLFEHGSFDAAATTRVSQALIWYAIAVLSDSLSQPLWRVVYAYHASWTFFKVNLVQTVVRFSLNLLLPIFFGSLGIALSALVGLTLQLIILLIWVFQRLGYQSLKTIKFSAIWTVFSSIIAGVLMSEAAKILTGKSSLVLFLVIGFAGIAGYLLVQYLAIYIRRSDSDYGSGNRIETRNINSLD